MKLLRKILVPFVPIYFLVTWLRNKFYDLGVFKSQTYSLPIICVGNLSTGGTGKSPMIEYLVRVLNPKKYVAILSRGYKRTTTGFKLADNSDTAKSIGDEPFQFYNKFGETVQVAVDADRSRGIANLMTLPKKPDIILLDDAFQHRKVKAGLNILLTTYANLYVNDWVLPTGNLREPKVGANRAQIILVTKCPEHLTDNAKQKLLNKLQPKSYQTVYFSCIKYSKTIYGKQSSRKLTDLSQFTLVTGIANPDPLVTYLKEQQLDFKHVNFPDHYDFKPNDIKKLQKSTIILTTEKDYMRLKAYEDLQDKLFYLPIETLVFNSKKLEKQLQDYVSNRL